MSVYEDLLQDTIDLHCHVDIEFSLTDLRKRQPEWEWLPKAEALGMRGVVLKSHWWPTAHVVPYVKQLYQGPTELWSSVVLNPIAGGAELWAVEAAAAMGARVVYLPTWGSSHDLENPSGTIFRQLGRIFKTFDPAQVRGVTFLEDGKLTPRAHELLELCQSHDLTLATGHVSWQEALAFAEEAHRRKYERLILTHPLARTPLDVLRRAAELGAWVEVCWTNIQPGRRDPAEVVQWIYAIGIEQVCLSTDYFRAPQPSPPELFRYFLGTLFDAGLKQSDVRTVAAINSARALGL